MISLLGNGKSEMHIGHSGPTCRHETLIVQRYLVVVRNDNKVYVDRNNGLRPSLSSGTIQPQ
jgi:hypothetical protein